MMNSFRSIITTFLRRFAYTKSYSQFGEDAVVQALFRNKQDGFYVDVGAYHPFLYSNTAALYLRGWHGLSIDPNPQLGVLYTLFRRRDTFINCAIGEGETHTYYMFSDPAYNTINKKTASMLKKQNYPLFTGSQTVPTMSLKEIIKEHNIQHIDFMNIDVEGVDLNVLKTHNWSVPPTVISVEHSSDEIRPFLTSNGYQEIGSVGKSRVYILQKPSR